jgi:hypothetical protein
MTRFVGLDWASPEHAVCVIGDPGRVCCQGGAEHSAAGRAELGDDRTRFATDEALAAEAGGPPGTRSSGKHHAVGSRWACDERLRLALTTFADNSRHTSSGAAAVYAAARRRDCDPPMRSAAWPAWGFASCCVVGRIAVPTTSLFTTAPSASSPPDDVRVDTGCLIAPPDQPECPNEPFNFKHPTAGSDRWPAGAA